jgi:hypothetical protein
MQYLLVSFLESLGACESDMGPVRARFPGGVIPLTEEVARWAGEYRLDVTWLACRLLPHELEVTFWKRVLPLQTLQGPDYETAKALILLKLLKDNDLGNGANNNDDTVPLPTPGRGSRSEGLGGARPPGPGDGAG